MDKVFVFDSDTGGHHSTGASLQAYLKHGATYGQGEGLQGHAYAIPTKDADLRPLPLAEIRAAVKRFLAYAEGQPNTRFHIVPIGVSDNSFLPEQIAPLFAGAPANCDLPYAFLAVQQGHTITNLELRQRMALADALKTVGEIASLAPALDDPDMPADTEAVCAIMMACYDYLRSAEGDEFVCDWLRAAMRAAQPHADRVQA